MLPLLRRLALVALLIVSGVAFAPLAQAQEDDPPDRVARLNYISGQVSFRPADVEDWGVATLNYPLSTGDHLWTDRNARAEMHLGAAVFRLAPETAFAFLDLDTGAVQARVAEGTLDVRIRQMYDGDSYEIDTPTAAITIVRPGVYRIDVDPDGARTRVIVRAGQVQVNGEGTSFTVFAGSMAEIAGDEETRFDMRRAPAPDGWEQWCRDRDRREDNRLALQYVPQDLVGYEDLDDYGTWNYVAEYGWTWEPTVVAADWAPYRYGNWTWRRQWGWTWVDSAPWGFAPFHYGRWAYYRSHWRWVPGRFAGRPVWAPALVAFVGGRNWNVSFAVGSRPAVGWFPLAPGELYRPSYRVSDRYVRRLNVTNVNVTNYNVTHFDAATARYANRNIAGAVTAVPRDVFVASQPVQRAAIAVPRNVADREQVVNSVDVAPGARSVFAQVPRAVPRPPAAAVDRPVMARVQPRAEAAPAGPVVTLGARARARTAPPEADSARPAAASGAPANDRGTATGRSRDNQWPAWAGGNDRPASGYQQPPTAQAPAPSYGRPSRTEPAAAPRVERRARSEAPAPGYQAPKYEAPRYEAPRYERPSRTETPAAGRPAEVQTPAPRSERPSAPPTPRAEPPAGHAAPPAAQPRSRTEDRGSDKPAPAPQAHGRDDRPSAPAPRVERPSAPSAPAAGAAAPRSQPPANGGGRGGDRPSNDRRRGGN